jgi:prophage regulatory protein
MVDRFLSRAEVCDRVGLSRMTVWRLQRKGEFPAFTRLSKGRVGIAESEVERWQAGERSGWPVGPGGRWQGRNGSKG